MTKYVKLGQAFKLKINLWDPRGVGRQPIRVYPYSTPNYQSDSNWFKIGATYWLAEGAPRFEERTR